LQNIVENNISLLHHTWLIGWKKLRFNAQCASCASANYGRPME